MTRRRDFLAPALVMTTAGGGRVHFPAGDYLSHSIHLKNNVSLYLNESSTIIAADSLPPGSRGGYDLAEPNEWDAYQDFGHSHWHNSLIWGEDLDDVAILGPALIWGRGLSKGYGPSRIVTSNESWNCPRVLENLSGFQINDVSINGRPFERA